MPNISAKERLFDLLTTIQGKVKEGKMDSEEAIRILQMVLEKKGAILPFDPEEFFQRSKAAAIKFYKKWGLDPSCLEKAVLPREFAWEMAGCHYQLGFDFLGFTLPISPASYIFKKGDPGKDALPFVIYPDSNKESPLWINQVIVESNYFREVASASPEVFFMKTKPGCDQKDDGIARTNDLKYPQIIELEKQFGLGGMGLAKALVFQRYYYGKFKKHPHDWREYQQIWLTETAEKIVPGYCANFCWNSDSSDRRWHVVLWGATSARAPLGSVFSRSSALKMG